MQKETNPSTILTNNDYSVSYLYFEKGAAMAESKQYATGRVQKRSWLL